MGHFPCPVLLVVPKSSELCFLATLPLLVCRQNSLSWYMECAFFLFDKRLCRCRRLNGRHFFRGTLAQLTTLQSIANNIVSNVCLLRFCRAIQPHTAPHPCNKKCVTYSNPIYIGYAILELSKILWYAQVYEHLLLCN